MEQDPLAYNAWIQFPFWYLLFEENLSLVVMYGIRFLS